MSASQPTVICSANLSIAWANAFLHAHDARGRGLAPLVVSIGSFSGPLPIEDSDIRKYTDAALARCKKVPIRATGLTIFPYDMWVRRGKQNCDAFSAFCVERLLPRLRKRDKRNALGTYFARMMSFTGKSKDGDRTVNQLSHVVALLKQHRRPRESALQLACFDPAKDHTRQPVRGFPCLQQLGIALDDENRFAINAFYPTQYMFDRAYGNYLGLCHLGAFISHETGLIFSGLSCFVGRPLLGKVTKGAIDDLVKRLRQRVVLLNGV